MLEESGVARKVVLHVDALVAIVVVFAASFGFNLYQRYQYASLLKEHTQLQWKAQDTEFNWKIVKGKLDKCAAAAEAATPAAKGE
jgi:hypothetical protein